MVHLVDQLIAQLISWTGKQSLVIWRAITCFVVFHPDTFAWSKRPLAFDKRSLVWKFLCIFSGCLCSFRWLVIRLHPYLFTTYIIIWLSISWSYNGIYRLVFFRDYSITEIDLFETMCSLAWTLKSLIYNSSYHFWNLIRLSNSLKTQQILSYKGFDSCLINKVKYLFYPTKNPV